MSFSDLFERQKPRQGTPPALPEGTVRQRLRFYGRVQGVGFRYRAYYMAEQLGLTGWVENCDDETVCMEVQGTPARIEKMLSGIKAGGYIEITGIDRAEQAPNPWERGFHVRGYF